VLFECLSQPANHFSAFGGHPVTKSRAAIRHRDDGISYVSELRAGEVTMRFTYPAIISFFILFCPLSGTAQVSPPPKARVAPVEDVYFGTRVSDPYRWMEAPDNIELRGWLAGQAQYAEATLAKIPGRPSLLARIHSLNGSQIEITNIVRGGDRIFFLSREANQSVARVMYRDGPRGTEKPLFDPSRLPHSAGYAEVGWLNPSSDGRYFTRSVSKSACTALEDIPTQGRE
jgi:hypothetical protein